MDNILQVQTAFAERWLPSSTRTIKAKSSLRPNVKVRVLKSCLRTCKHLVHSQPSPQISLGMWGVGDSTRSHGITQHDSGNLVFQLAEYCPSTVAQRFASVGPLQIEWLQAALLEIQ